MVAVAGRGLVFGIVLPSSTGKRRTMPIKPNYNLRRADRQRAQQQKRDEKEQARQDKVAKRKAARDDIPPGKDEPATK